MTVLSCAGILLPGKFMKFNENLRSCCGTPVDAFQMPNAFRASHSDIWCILRIHEMGFRFRISRWWGVRNTFSPSLARSRHDERIKVEEMDMGHLFAVSVTEFKLENYSNWRKIVLRQASRFFVEFIAIRPQEQRMSFNRSIHDDSVDWRHLSLLLFLIGHRFIHYRGDSLCLHSMHFLAMRLARQIPNFIYRYFAWMKLASHESLCRDVNVVMHFHVSICLRRNM